MSSTINNDDFASHRTGLRWRRVRNGSRTMSWIQRRSTSTSWLTDSAADNTTPLPPFDANVVMKDDAVCLSHFGVLFKCL
ncbi:unnamed protein product [Strongylus vulgaris]|uniref:Uncharacterized protein n=1 Tax=Strongylus vulgaris TaxID=40348 RepID=A0A3P7INR9_STRVU|nr:unnamed protein product [Strongylus vulgaris]